ncbi:hypothetical protein BH11MYX2_BH11MYX2_26890 [soil metagenome]
MADPKVPPANVIELEEGLRHLHRMEMQTKLRLDDVEAKLEAAAKLLHRAQIIHERSLEAEISQQRMRLNQERRGDATVVLGPDVDKYEVETSKVNCAERMHLCKARCCRLAVALDFKDVEDGLRWEYSRPYEIKRDKTSGYCVYSEEKTHRCHCYDQRPAICRTYDCSTDARVWDDFEKMIPAKWMDEVAVTPLVQIRLPTK